jgi:hypothetical protein
MMTRQETIAAAVENGREQVKRYLVGFDDGNRTLQAPNVPNHAAWTLGHVALTNHRIAGHIDGSELPAVDFVTGDGTAGDARRFDTESICFASAPLDDAARYPTLERALEIFDASCDRLAGAARRASDEQLDAEIPWASTRLGLGMLILRGSMHMAVHAGQLVDLRRVLGLGSIFAQDR